MNSTPLGAVLSESALKRHRVRAGLRICAASDAGRIDLFRFVAWLAAERCDARATNGAGSGQAVGGAGGVGGGGGERRLTASQIAAVLGVHVNNIKYHVGRGMPYELDRRGVRRFDEAECRAWLVARGSVHYNGGNKLGAYAGAGALGQETVNAATNTGGDSGKDSGKDRGKTAASAATDDPDSPLGLELRLKRAKAEEIETKTAERKGTLVNAQEVRAVFTAHLVSARVAFEAVAVKAAGRVLAALELDNSRHHAIVAAIKEEIDQAMQLLSEAP